MSVSQCGPNQFTCDNECLELSRKCDKIRDCLDRSDEENCGYSSVVLSDFDRIAQLGLFITIGIIGLVSVIILAVVFTICMRRNKRRQLASVEVIQVPSHYIKTHEGPHSSTIGSAASGPAINCSNNAYRDPGNQQESCSYFGDLVQQQPSGNDPAVAPRSHRPNSRRSNRSRRSTSSGHHHHRARHVAADGTSIAQPPTALSGDSGIAATGSTTVSTSGVVAPARPSSVHSSHYHGRREGNRPPIPAAFRHSFHGSVADQPVQQQVAATAAPDNLQQASPPVLASSSSGVLETSPPPPYSTFDRTVYAGRMDNSDVTNEPSHLQPQQPQQRSSSALFMSQRGVFDSNRNNTSSALSRVEQNVLYGDPNALRQQQQPPRVSPSADYTRMWIERVSAEAAAANNTPQPVASTPFREDTLLAEQSYAQQIRQALRKNQSQLTPRQDASATERVASQTPQSLASGYLNNSNLSPFTNVTPSPTRVVTPQYAQIIARKPLTATFSSSTANNQSNAPIAIISKRPMPLNV